MLGILTIVSITSRLTIFNRIRTARPLHQAIFRLTLKVRDHPQIRVRIWNELLLAIIRLVECQTSQKVKDTVVITLFRKWLKADHRIHLQIFNNRRYTAEVSNSITFHKRVVLESHLFELDRVVDLEKPRAFKWQLVQIFKVQAAHAPISTTKTSKVVFRMPMFKILARSQPTL